MLFLQVQRGAGRLKELPNISLALGLGQGWVPFVAPKSGLRKTCALQKAPSASSQQSALPELFQIESLKIKPSGTARAAVATGGLLPPADVGGLRTSVWA